MQEKYLKIMKERENGTINFGNTIINTRVSFLNYPKGFLRKQIIKQIIESNKDESWNLNLPYKYEILEKYMYKVRLKKKEFLI